MLAFSRVQEVSADHRQLGLESIVFENVVVAVVMALLSRILTYRPEIAGAVGVLRTDLADTAAGVLDLSIKWWPGAAANSTNHPIPLVPTLVSTIGLPLRVAS